MCRYKTKRRNGAREVARCIKIQIQADKYKFLGETYKKKKKKLHDWIHTIQYDKLFHFLNTTIGQWVYLAWMEGAYSKYCFQPSFWFDAEMIQTIKPLHWSLHNHAQQTMHNNVITTLENASKGEIYPTWWLWCPVKMCNANEN